MTGSPPNLSSSPYVGYHLNSFVIKTSTVHTVALNKLIRIILKITYVIIIPYR